MLKEGVVATTGKVSIQARTWAKNKPIRILELDEIVNLIRTHYREDDIVPEHLLPLAFMEADHMPNYKDGVLFYRKVCGGRAMETSVS